MINIIVTLLRLSFVCLLCNVSAYVQADLFDLYELGCWRTGVPEHIQQQIGEYYSNCICTCVVPEQVDCLEFIDTTSVKVLARKGTRAYALSLGEKSYQMSLLEASEFQNYIPAVANFAVISDIQSKREDAQAGSHMVLTVASPLVKTILPETKTKDSSFRGFILKQHSTHKAQWYLYKCMELRSDDWYAIDALTLLNVERVPLEGVSKTCFIATTHGTDVYIFKRKGYYFEYFFCLPHRVSVAAAAFSPDNTRIVTACKDSTLHVWSLLAASAGKLATLEQLLLLKLVDTACYYEGSWDFDTLARRLQVVLAENLADQTHTGVVAYLSSVFTTLSPESQQTLNLWRKNTVKRLRKQNKCSIS